MFPPKNKSGVGSVGRGQRYRWLIHLLAIPPLFIPNFLYFYSTTTLLNGIVITWLLLHLYGYLFAFNNYNKPPPNPTNTSNKRIHTQTTHNTNKVIK